jgi:N-acetylmuramic acid 6-phosphate etherase
MLGKLLTEQVNPQSANIDVLDTESMLRVINAEDRKVADAVAQAIPSVARALDGIVARVTQGGRLFYIGAGTSGRLGVLDAAECPPTFRVPPDLVQGIIAGGERALARATEASEDSEEMGARDLLEREFTGKDALVGIAASGRTPYVLGAVDRAREIGALTVGISCTPDSELAKRVEIALTLLAGPEIIAGSTRMKAGTATKMALNMLSTGLMIRLGHTFGNLMVNVQPTNSKLADRARRIVAEAAGVDSQRAARILEDAGNNVKTAVVMGRGGLTRQEAEQRLESVGGVIVKALKWTS